MLNWCKFNFCNFEKDYQIWNKFHREYLKCSNPFNKLKMFTFRPQAFFQNNEFTLFTVTFSLLLSLTLSMKSKTSVYCFCESQNKKIIYKLKHVKIPLKIKVILCTLLWSHRTLTSDFISALWNNIHCLAAVQYEEYPVSTCRRRCRVRNGAMSGKVTLPNPRHRALCKSLQQLVNFISASWEPKIFILIAITLLK